MELKEKDDKVVGGFCLLQLTLLFPEVLLLGEHSASAAAVHLRIAVTGIGTSRPVFASLFWALELKLRALELKLRVLELKPKTIRSPTIDCALLE